MARKIIRSKDLCEGRARLAGTRIEVQAVIRMVQEGSSLERMCDAFPGLTLGDLHVIRAYYTGHTAEIDQDMAGETPAATSMSLRDRIFAFIELKGKKGATDKEVQKALGVKVTTEVPRRGELVKAGRVVNSGKFRRRAIVWVVKKNEN
jgi:uncharacterized protein (DUF433 family)